MPDEELHEHLPLTEATFFILLSLAPGPKHGYAIVKDVQSLSDGRVILSTGTLYGAIKRLLDQGWIARVQLLEGTEPNGRDIKYYELTLLGQRVLSAETERLRSLLRATQDRLTTMQG